MHQVKDLDLLQMPAEGVAAYWLALKKMLGSSKNFKALEQEAEFASEPFIRHLLSISFGNFAEARIRLLAAAKAEQLQRNIGLRLDLMRVCLLDMLSVENPHRTLAKMMAQYIDPPASPAKIFKYAQALLKQKPDGQNAASHFNVTSRLSDDRLVTVLIFYNLLVRHIDKMACQNYIPHIQSRFFRDGLALIIDGFEEPFVRRWLRVHKAATLHCLTQNMNMSLELCLALRERCEYEEMELVARSFLP